MHRCTRASALVGEELDWRHVEILIVMHEKNGVVATAQRPKGLCWSFDRQTFVILYRGIV